MSSVYVRPAEPSDLTQIVEIYNHYVLNTQVTFDVEPYTAETRRPWFEQFARTGRHRLFVAEDLHRIVGYASTCRYRPKPAYETSVEFSVYCAPDSVARGIGRQLYDALFDAIRSEDVHRALAGITRRVSS